MYRFGLCTLICFFAFVGVSVSSASAGIVGAEGIPASLSSAANTKSTFGSEAGSIVCEKSSYSGTLSTISEQFRLNPSYSNCTAFGFLTATVTSAGCGYEVHVGSEISSQKFAGTTDVACEAGKTITISAGTCEVKIKPQTGLSGLEIIDHPASSPENASVKFTVSGISYEVTKDGALCPFAGTGVKSGGSYADEPTVNGLSEGVGVGFFALSGPVSMFCEGEVEKCEQGQDLLTLPFKIEASSANPEIVIGKTSVKCTSASLEMTVVGILGNSDALAHGQKQEFVGCKTASGNCTSVKSLPIFLSAFHAGAKGNGTWEGTKLYIYVECGPDAICRYSATQAPHLTFTGGKGATITAKATKIAIEPVTGEKNCVAEAELNLTYTISKPANLELTPVAKPK